MLTIKENGIMSVRAHSHRLFVYNFLYLQTLSKRVHYNVYEKMLVSIVMDIPGESEKTPGV